MRAVYVCTILILGLTSLCTGHNVSSFARGNCLTVGISEICSDDCADMISCINGIAEHTNCQQATGRPYCQQVSPNIVTCVSNPDACAGTLARCPEDGIFPNLLNCKKFTKCAGSAVNEYECVGNTVYHGGEQLCMADVQCYYFSPLNGLCEGKLNMRLAYPLAPKLYVYCAALGPNLRKCRGDWDNHILFDPKNSACAFICPAKGLFPDPEDATSYYECAAIGNTLRYTHKKCPEGTEFDTEKKKCVPE